MRTISKNVNQYKMCVRFFSTFLQEIFDAINAGRVKSRFSETVKCVTYGDFHLQQLVAL
jgi:hypothetical protein